MDASIKDSAFAGESTLTDAMTKAGQTYEEIAQLVAEQVSGGAVISEFTWRTFYLKKKKR